MKKNLKERIEKATKGSSKFRSGAKRRRKYLHGKEKVPAVMREFKKGTLRSGSGKKVSNIKQAIAIAMSEAGMSKKK